MNHRYTPGPWIVKSPKDDTNAYDVFPQADPYRKLHHGKWALNAKATAHLIAAAPDMFEALEHIIDLADKFHLVQPSEYAEVIRFIRHQATSAIAKAEGIK